MLRLSDQSGEFALARPDVSAKRAGPPNVLSPAIALGSFARALPSACSGTSEISITSTVGAEYTTGLSVSNGPIAAVWARTDTPAATDSVITLRSLSLAPR